MAYQRQEELYFRPRAKPAAPAAGTRRIFVDENGEPQIQDSDDNLTPLRTTQLSQLTDAGTMAGQNADAVALTGGSASLTGAMKTSAGGLGYAAGAGGTVTQTSSKTNVVTLNKLTGKITTTSSNIGAGDSATFTLNNSEIEAEDHIVVQHLSGGTFTDYLVEGRVTGAGAASITIRNLDTVTNGNVLVLKFTVIKGTAS